jgi:tetratricopeptide (TPR) repeat protein
MDALSKLETRFYVLRTTLRGRPQFVVAETLSSPKDTRLIGLGVQAIYVLDGEVSVTDRLKLRVRFQETKTGRILANKDYAEPTEKAGALLERVARDLLLALPGKLGAQARSAPVPGHEPTWAALLAYLEAEDLRFSRESGVGEAKLAAIFDRYLLARQLDPDYARPGEALTELALMALKQGAGTADVPLGALERLVALHPTAETQGALARGLEQAGRPVDAQEAWKKSVEADPKFVLGWLNIAEGKRRGGDYRGATSALEKAVRIGLPTRGLQARAESDLGALYVELGEADKAIAVLEASVKANPKDPEAYFRLGSAYGRKGSQSPKDNKRWIDLATQAFKTSDRLKGLDTPPFDPPAKGGM